MENCIVISDTHAPYHHRDTLDFLAAIKYAYDIKIAKHSGDLADNHTVSYHEIEYGTMSARDEYHRTVNFVRQLQKLFPELVVVLGNHCALTRRKAKTAGIPEEALKDYNTLYGVNWKWQDKDYFKINAQQSCLLTHSMSKSTLNNAKTHSHCSIQGHHHGTMGIEYFADTETLRWSMTVGCLIDHNSPAFNYAKFATNNRPLLGCGAIIEDSPIIIPMTLKKSGRWNGRL